jgi:hypothetical protein
MVRGDGLIEGHPRHHGGIPECLHLHVRASIVALQLNHDEVRVAVDAEEVDAPALASQAPNSSAITIVSGATMSICARSSRCMSARSRIPAALKLVGGHRRDGGVSHRVERHVERTEQQNST